MKIGTPRECYPGENRVAMTPSSAIQLRKLGHESCELPARQFDSAFTRSDSKRGQGTGYSGIEYPLFFVENTRMFYGDAKSSVDKLLAMID